MERQSDRFWPLLALASAAGFAFAVVIHNLVSIASRGDEPLFFVAVLVTPVGAVVGALGTLVVTLRRHGH